ncbi:MAG: (Fe-S)-binding protein [Acidobacteriota bacterium]|nr:MAG: (Fe-S)-binding protein [Acidobacteriota bacterium]
MSFATWERVLLLLLIAGTLTLFVKDLTPKIRHILAGQPERVRTDRLGERIWRVIKEVIFQWRVVGGRPVAGLMHAVVFFGFIGFAFETTDHFLEPFHLPFMATVLGSYEPAFKVILAIVAVVVAIAIAGLAFRRFVLVNISPDPKSYSSGIVAAMIFLLMLTYIYGLQEQAALAKANWWVHSLLIIAFPPLILRSKHFHILMAPVDIFFRTHTLGEFLPLNLDMEALEDSEEEISLGLETMSDVPWKMRMDFLTCVECKRCTDQCPAASCGQELKPREFILAGRKMLGQEGSVIGSVISEMALGQCTSCGACENICPVGIEHLQLLLGAKRAQALSSGKGMVATDFLQTIEKYENPFAERQQVRKKLIEELGIPIYKKGETEYLLWLGCVWSYNQDARSSLEAMVRVLSAAGVSYGVLESESCSGHHSRRQGEELQFQTLAGQNIERFRENAVTKIVAPCPHCLHTFRREYPTLDGELAYETIHHSQLLIELVQQGKLPLAQSAANGKRLTFHDPCYLGRYEKVFEAPRDVIARTGFTIAELPRRRERSFCCGGGNAGFMSQKEEERRVDQERKEEIQRSGANVLVTACPECNMMLDATVDETKDLAELVADCLR